MALSTAPDPVDGAILAHPLPKRALEEIAGRMECAEEEWKVAHLQCLAADEEFAHELAQLLFALGAVRLSFRKKHGV